MSFSLCASVLRRVAGERSHFRAVLPLTANFGHCK
jgi:hypothetical protein